MRRSWVGPALLTPIAALIVMMILIPLGEGIRQAFIQAPLGIGPGRFVGWANFSRVLGDPVFWQALKNSLVWTASNLILQLTLPLFIALLLNERFTGNSLVRTVLLTPWITPGVVVAVMFRWILEPTIGIMNDMLFTAGLISKPLILLGSRSHALPTLIAINTWKFLPFGTLLILASLQTIPQELREASRADGASFWQQLGHVTLPIITPMIWFVAFLAFTWNFNLFDLIWLTTEGGPANASMTLPVLIYKKAFKMLQMGDAAAIAVMASAVLVVLGVLYFKFAAPPEEG